MIGPRHLRVAARAGTRALGLGQRMASAQAEGTLQWPLGSVMSLDIGGSLTKLVVRSPAGVATANDVSQGGKPWDVEHAVAAAGSGGVDGPDGFVGRILRRMPRHPGYRAELELSDGMGGALSFLQFETRWMDDFVDILADLHPFPQHPDGGELAVPATGGGAFKFAPMFREKLGFRLEPSDEMHALARGMRYFEAASAHRWAEEEAASGAPSGTGAGTAGASEVPPPLSPTGPEMFTYDLGGDRVVAWRDPAPGAPCLLVSIGSGVSIIKVGQSQPCGDVSVDRVNGCSVGGATFWGLCRLLTSYRTFDEAVQAADVGDNSKIAMLVSDIYGGEYAKLGLPGDIVASDFGKVGTRRYPRAPCVQKREDGSSLVEPAVEEADLTRALLVMVLNNIAQVAHSSAREHGIDRIFFGGSFLRRGTMMRVLTSALKFWSGGKTRAAFMRHEGYFGAMGAMLLAAHRGADKGLAALPLPGSDGWEERSE